MTAISSMPDQAFPSPSLPVASPASSTGQRYPVVLGYRLTRVLGGGGFSRVFKAVNPDAPNRKEAAVKVVSYAPITSKSAARHPADRQALQKEVQIHNVLKHANVLEFMGADEFGTSSRPAGSYVPGLYMVLEYAAGGDLFDKIAPDMGVGDDLAQYYFHQLVDGLEYIHSQGITHRDIKPENLLLSAGGDMKIADFGLCSVYKYKGKERSLKGACGSLPYIAPEMNGTPYKGEGVDVWSAGVVLFAMLAGNTPWDEPTTRSPEYTAYLDGSLLGFEPWNKIGESALSLVTSLLQPRPDLRLTLEGIRAHPWMQQPNRFLQTNISAEEKTGDLVQAFMEKMAEAGDLPLHTDGMRAEVPSAPASTQIEHVSGAATALEEFEIKVPSASMGPAVGGDERAKRMMLSQSLANRRMATQTQNPHSTQFQELWAGMTQWADLANSIWRGSGQTTQFFVDAETQEVVEAMLQILPSFKAQTQVYVSRAGGEHRGEQHLLDMSNLIEGFTKLTQEPEQKKWNRVFSSTQPATAVSSEDAGDMSIDDDQDGDDHTMAETENPEPSHVNARIHVALTDKRKCPLSGNIVVVALPIRERPGFTVIDGQRKQIKTLVKFERSSGSPLEWRRLFGGVIRSSQIKHHLVPM